VTAEVTDVIAARSELVSSDLVLVSEEDFRKLFGLQKGYATDLAVAVRTRRS